VAQGLSDGKFGLDSSPGYTAYHGGAAGRAHNEAAFRHFLNIELRRASASGHGVLLVLVAERDNTGRSIRIAPLAASKVFSALGASVREVDFVGWFKEGRIAAAVLVQRTTSTAEMRQQIAGRVMKTLKEERFPSAGVTRVRIVPLRGMR
jgi:hypothetical protein